MDSAGQAAGEARVETLLIKPLQARGLMRPAGMKADHFAEMLAGLKAKLAYMSEANLHALEETASGMAGGKDKDRFPIANRILDEAAMIQPPDPTSSPLIRKVFASAVGEDAIRGGYAPELLALLRRRRKWPEPYALTRLEADAGPDVSRLRRIETRLVNGDDVTESDEEWRNLRRAAMQRCKDLRALGQEGEHL